MKFAPRAERATWHEKAMKGLLWRRVAMVQLKKWATLAQLVERLIRNQQVAGSIPAGGSIESIRYGRFGRFLVARFAF